MSARTWLLWLSANPMQKASPGDGVACLGEHRDQLAHGGASLQVMKRPSVRRFAAGVVRADAGDARREDLEIALRRKDDGRVGLRARGGDFDAFADDDRLALGGGKIERHRHVRRARRVELDSEHLQERDEHQVRHLVDAVQQHLRHPSEQFDQGDPRIADVVVGPFGAVLGDQPLGVIHDLLEFAVVEYRRSQWHGLQSVVLSAFILWAFIRLVSGRRGRRANGGRSSP